MSANTWSMISIICFLISAIFLIVSLVIFFKMNILAVIGDLSGKTVARELEAMRLANETSGDKRIRSSRINIERGTLTEKVNNKSVGKEVQELVHKSKRLDVSKKLTPKPNDKKTEPLEERTEVLSDTTTVVSYDETEVIDNKTKKLSKTEVLNSNKTDVLNNDLTEVLDKKDKNRPDTEVLGSNKVNGIDTEPTEVLNNKTKKLVKTQILEIDQTEVLYENSESEATTVLNPTEELSEDLDTVVEFKVTRSMVIIHTDEEI